MLRPLRVLYPLVVGLLALALSASALATKAKTNSLKLSGPSSNKIGAKFKYVESGYAVTPANFIWGWETSDKCLKKASKEYDHLGKPAHPTIGKKLTKENHSFSNTTKFKAQTLGKHYLCVYLINDQSLKTYARASAHWTNHS